jgi:hypothetical protein
MLLLLAWSLDFGYSPCRGNCRVGLFFLSFNSQGAVDCGTDGCLTRSQEATWIQRAARVNLDLLTAVSLRRSSKVSPTCGNRAFKDLQRRVGLRTTRAALQCFIFSLPLHIRFRYCRVTSLSSSQRAMTTGSNRIAEPILRHGIDPADAFLYTVILDSPRSRASTGAVMPPVNARRRSCNVKNSRWFCVGTPTQLQDHTQKLYG